MFEVATVDTETKRIKNRPEYPPECVGVAIREPGKRSIYLRWGHPSGNNYTKLRAAEVLQSIYRRYPILCHNAKFDLEVLHIHLGLPLIPPCGFHETEFLAFLDNPHAAKLSLKPLAEHYLNIPPDEQDHLHDWIRSHVFLSDAYTRDNFTVTVADKKPKGYYKVPETKAGAFISLAPGDLVDPYARGDVDRTYKLFRKLYTKIKKRGMLDAYHRELKLMPILLRNEQEGMRTNVNRLRRDVPQWSQSIVECDRWLERKLKCKDLNVDSDNELADALENAGLVEEWILTEKGQRSTSKANLKEVVLDPVVTSVLEYRSTMKTITGTFGKPWLRMAEADNGFIKCNWNQVRNTDERGKGSKGARTGRCQSSPNFLNIPNPFAEVKLPKALERKIVIVPNIRSYIIPDDKHSAFGHRDYSQQEYRILGHYEDGQLMRTYNELPETDMHQYVRGQVNALLGSAYERKPIKNVGFGILYGLGLPGLAANLNTDKAHAKKIKKAYLEAMPGIQDVIDIMYEKAEAGEALRTWGGREYFCEPEKFVKKFGRIQTFEYKMINYLIQGSAADCTKEAIIRVNDVIKDARFLVTVHDELNFSIKKKAFKREMQKIKDAMESIEFDIPMLTDGGRSDKGWVDVVDYYLPSERWREEYKQPKAAWR